jgi:uncharacterized membrane protein YgcG
VLARSVRTPLIISVGTGIVLVSGTAAAIAATDTPSSSASPTESDTPTPTPTPTATPALSLAFTRVSTAAVHAGTAVKFTARVSDSKADAQYVRLSLDVDSKATLSKQCATSAGLCQLGDIDAGNHQDVTFTITVDKGMDSGTIHITGQALGKDGVESKVASYSLKVTKKPSSSSSSSPSKSSGSSKSSSSSGSSSSGSSSTSDLPSGLGKSSGAGATPSVAPSNDPAVLPSIAPTQAPSTAPVVNTGNSQQMRGTTDAADELTFDKLASTQAAWLAALLVAFSLLLTQVRLGRANARSPKQKGAHRRARRSGGAAH